MVGNTNTHQDLTIITNTQPSPEKYRYPTTTKK